MESVITVATAPRSSSRRLAPFFDRESETARDGLSASLLPNKSIQFFDAQFQRQILAKDYKLNPLEARALLVDDAVSTARRMMGIVQVWPGRV